MTDVWLIFIVFWWGLGVVWVFFGGCFGSPRGGITFPHREAGYSHYGDRSRSTGRQDIRTKPCFFMLFGKLCRPRVRVFAQHSHAEIPSAGSRVGGLAELPRNGRTQPVVVCPAKRSRIRGVPDSAKRRRLTGKQADGARPLMESFFAVLSSSACVPSVA